MKQQNFNNHAKLVPLFHGVTALLLLIGVSGAILNFIQALGKGSSQLEAGLFLLLFIVAFFFFGLFDHSLWERKTEQYVQKKICAIIRLPVNCLTAD